MSRLSRFFARLLLSLRQSRAERELSREITSHLQLLEDEFVAKGMSREEARYAAKRAFGGVEQAKERQRDERSFRWLTGWSMDLKLGVRMLGRTPGLTLVAVVALAIGIGSGAAHLEFVNDLVRPRLAFAGGDRLVGLLTYDLAKGDVDERALHELGIWKERLTTVEHLGAAHIVEHNLTDSSGRIEPMMGAELSASAFRVVPTPPLHGRPLIEEDERPDAPPVLILGEALWRRRFNADPAVVGRTARYGDTLFTIAGVMPGAFGFPLNQQLWIPFKLNPRSFRKGEGPIVRVFGRLREEVDLDEAQAELDLIATREPRALSAGADTSADKSARATYKVLPYVASVWAPNDMKWQVRVFYGANVVFLALLGICAVNVATLVFARTVTREPEITVRTALGASRGRIVAQLIAEALVFTSIAAAAGLAGATLALRWVRALWDSAQSSPMPFWWNEQLGIETIAYAALLVVMASIAIGAMPAIKATGPRMQARLKEAGSTGGTMRFGKLWTGVIVGQAAVTIVLLLGVVSIGLSAIESGRQFGDVAAPRHEYMTAHVFHPAFREAPAHADAEAARARWTSMLRELHRRLNDDPAIINAAYTVRYPGANAEEFRLEFAEPSLDAQAQARKDRDVLWVRSQRVGANFFETMNQRVLAGRTFTEGEVEAGRTVAVVDESFVRLVFGGVNPIGVQVREPASGDEDKPGPWFEIVGVVRDGGLRAAAGKKTSDAMLYRPRELGANAAARLIVHSRAHDVAARMRAAAGAVDPELGLGDILTLERYGEIEQQTAGFFVTVVAVIGGVALLLSTAGIYALISFTLSRRTREIGIRTALGASPRKIISGILSGAGLQVATGLAIGAIPGYFLMATDLSNEAARTPLAALSAVAAVAALIVIVTAIACIPPVRRALRIQPTEALRTT